jgi:hypothetical protein
MTVVVAPEGLEFDLVVYLKATNVDGVHAVLRISGLPVLPELHAAIDAPGLTAKLPLGFDWRVMTRAEIAAFKAREDDDD